MRITIFALTLLLTAAAIAQSSNIDRATASRTGVQNTPGHQFLERGNRFYRSGDYQAAADNFKQAAYWADKIAQFNLGLLHVNGEGVSRDVLLGWAWIELAAERGDPTYRDVADDIWSKLAREHRTIARQILDQELKPEYGDEVAVDRTRHEMERHMRGVTAGGSRTGVTRVTYVEDAYGLMLGTDFYRPERRDFQEMMTLEEHMLQAGTADGGVVSITDQESTDDADDDSGRP